MSARHRSADLPDGVADVAITVVSGDPDAAELAAITAVLSAAAREAEEAAALATQHGPGAWARSTRQLRMPLTPGAGAWRAFTP